MQEKSFDKGQRPFVAKTPHKIGIKENFLNTKKASYKKPTANIRIYGENLKLFL